MADSAAAVGRELTETSPLFERLLRLAAALSDTAHGHLTLLTLAPSGVPRASSLESSQICSSAVREGEKQVFASLRKLLCCQ